MFEPLSKVPYSFAALTSRCGNVIARTHHRFEYSRQTKSCLNSLTQKVSSLTEREDSKVLLPAHDINLGPRATFYKTRRFHLVITREWLFYFAKTSSIGKRMGGHGYLNIIIFRNGCNISPKKENRYCKKQQKNGFKGKQTSFVMDLSRKVILEIFLLLCLVNRFVLVTEGHFV